MADTRSSDMKAGAGMLYEVGLGGIVCDKDMKTVNWVNVAKLSPAINI